MTDQYHIAEDDAYAIYSMLEHVEGIGWYWVHLGRTATPHKQMSTRIKKTDASTLYKKGQVFWFVSEIIAKRVHREVCEHLDSVPIKRDGDNRAPKFAVTHGNVQSLVKYHAKQIGTPIIKESDIYRARGLRDARLLRKVGCS